MRMMTEGVWAMAPTRLQTHTTHRKMRKASWQPGIGHFPLTAVANSVSADIQEHPLRFCEEERQKIGEIKIVCQLCCYMNHMCRLGDSENIIIEALTELLRPQILKRNLMAIIISLHSTY